MITSYTLFSDGKKKTYTVRSKTDHVIFMKELLKYIKVEKIIYMYFSLQINSFLLKNPILKFKVKI